MKTSRITGYQIQYSLKSSFRNPKSFKVKGYDNVKRVIRNLRSKTRYYVRIRTYKTVGSRTYYSKWSPAKSVKTK